MAEVRAARRILLRHAVGYLNMKKSKAVLSHGVGTRPPVKPLRRAVSLCLIVYAL
jgi:hypothetical protein